MLGEKVGVWPGKIPSRSAAAAGHASWRRSSAPPDAAGVTRSLAAFVFLALTASAALADSSTDARFLAALRQRSLFELAEAYCRQELVRPGVPEIRQGGTGDELSATLAEAAASSAPENRVSLWQRAEQVADDFVRQHPENPARAPVAAATIAGGACPGRAGSGRNRRSPPRQSRLWSNAPRSAKRFANWISFRGCRDRAAHSVGRVARRAMVG